MMSLLFPLCTFFLLCLCIAYWASTAVYPFLFLFPAPPLPRKEAAQKSKVFQGAEHLTGLVTHPFAKLPASVSKFNLK